MDPAYITYVPSRSVKMPLYSFIFTRHSVLYYIDAIVISHMIFALRIQMYAEIALQMWR